ncbi:hypothetical protein CPLU01_14761 [Colletotrichum plurivorum]|uniref:Uncharacterized protein n=1 Tax=Colletotrichum plurivorum TaxID=2175906 RepID=A0A8H6JH78_9PEZI|nr:hypothetical protein CPLU01_14761 [Colletotrichum plurivorum]
MLIFQASRIRTSMAIEDVICEGVARALPSPITNAVKLKLSRIRNDDDMIMTVDVAPETVWLSTLFPDGVVRYKEISRALGPKIADGIDRSQLRQ